MKLKFLGVVMLVFDHVLSYDTIVTIPGLGKVGGSIRTFENDSSRTYYQYKGLPYAEPVERFVLATPKTPWNDTHDGTTEGKVCPQIGDQVFYAGDIDEFNCLVLTITTPQDPETTNLLLPVLVYYHGGAFIIGTTQTDWYNPEFLVYENIIVVQIQYRLGIFGWLTDGTRIPKNIGLKDCFLGLQWVHQNIQAFGGDPNQVTIYGESAGSMISANLWQSPKTNGMIVGVILQSGTSVNTISYQRDPKRSFDKFLMSNPCRTKPTIDEQVECLRNAPRDELSSNNGFLILWSDLLTYNAINGLNTSPVLEDPNDPDAMITSPPLEMLTNGSLQTNVPILLSTTNEEIFTFAILAEMLRTSTNEGLTPDGMQATNEDQVGRMIKTHYAGSELLFPVALNDTLIRLGSDITLNNGYRKFIDLVQARGVTIYCMLFDYASTIGFFNDGFKVGHADDLFYIWQMRAIHPKPIAPKEAFVKRMQINRMFANFAKERQPTPRMDPDLENFMWPKVTDLSAVQCMDFKNFLDVIVNPKQENYGFWKDLYNNYGPNAVTF